MSETKNSETSEFTIDSIFNKTPAADIEAANDSHKKEAPQKENPIKKEAKPVEEDLDVDDESDPTESKKSPEIDYKSEYEKLLKSSKDTQRSFHEDRKKLAAYKKAVEKMKEDGDLLDDEAALLLDHTKYEDVPMEETTIIKYGRIWDKELEYMKKYAPNPQEIEQHILAFQHFLKTAPFNELEEMMQDLSQYEDDEVELTRQMLERGRQYNEDVFSDIHNAGSIRQLKTMYKERENELQKRIDKLEKKINKYREKYEDYDDQPGNLNLPSGSGNHNPPSASFDLASVFEKPYQKHSRF